MALKKLWITKKIIMLFLKIVRWFFAVVISIFLMSFIGASLPAFSTVEVLHDKENLIKWFEEANMYNKISDQIVDEIIEEVKNKSGGVSYLSEDDQQIILKSSFSADWIQQEIERNIDAAYEWMNGDSDSPEFYIDLSGKEESIKAQVADSLKKKFALLPACTSEDTLTTEFYLHIDNQCLPSNVTLDIVNAYIDDNVQEVTLLEDTKLELNKEPFSANMTTQVTRAYSYAGNTSFIFWSIVIVGCALIIVLIPGWTKGFVYIGTLLLIAGFSWFAISYWVDGSFDSFYDLVLDNIDSVETENVDETVDVIINGLVKDGMKLAIDDVLGQVRKMSISLIVVGVILIIVRFVIRWQQKKSEITAQNIQVKHNV